MRMVPIPRGLLVDPGHNTERRHVIMGALEVVLASVCSTGNFLLWEVFMGSRTKEHRGQTGNLPSRGRQKQRLRFTRQRGRPELANNLLVPPFLPRQLFFLLR